MKLAGVARRTGLSHRRTQKPAAHERLGLSTCDDVGAFGSGRCGEPGDRYEFEVTGEPEPRSGKGAPGTGRLFVNGNQVGQVEMDPTVPFLFSVEGLSVGSDCGDSVDHDNYRTTFPFSGTISQVAFDLSGDGV